MIIILKGASPVAAIAVEVLVKIVIVGFGLCGAAVILISVSVVRLGSGLLVMRVALLRSEVSGGWLEAVLVLVGALVLVHVVGVFPVRQMRRVRVRGRVRLLVRDAHDLRHRHRVWLGHVYRVRHFLYHLHWVRHRHFDGDGLSYLDDSHRRLLVFHVLAEVLQLGGVLLDRDGVAFRSYGPICAT